jgi:hypothetical protein
MTREQRIELSHLAGATGIWLFQWFALIPGLLPILVLTAALALPFVAAGVIAAAGLCLPYGAWKAAGMFMRALASVRT